MGLGVEPPGLFFCVQRGVKAMFRVLAAEGVLKGEELRKTLFALFGSF